jgi:GGDEF domain-containing protein
MTFSAIEKKGEERGIVCYAPFSESAAASGTHRAFELDASSPEFGNASLECARLKAAGRKIRIAISQAQDMEASPRLLAQLMPTCIIAGPPIGRDITRTAKARKAFALLHAIAEKLGSLMGIEGIDDGRSLEAAIRLGARLVAGNAVSAPSSSPGELAPGFDALLESARPRRPGSLAADEGIVHGSMAFAPLFEPGSITCGKLLELFNLEPSLDHAVLANRGEPIGVITKKRLKDLLCGRYGFAVFENKDIDLIVKTDILVLPADSGIRELGRLALARAGEEAFDPVVLVDSTGHYAGSMGIREIIKGAFEAELRVAESLNPLSGLPGNAMIERWMAEAIARGRFFMAWADLDHFKPFNDAFGFLRGDDMIKATASILRHSPLLGLEGASLGHVGGDDFVIVARGEPDESELDALCARFDQEIRAFFSEAEIEAGGFVSRDRRGRKRLVPLTRLSLAVVTNANFSGVPHPVRIAEAAARCKKLAKARNEAEGRSGWFKERRVYDELL